MVNPYKKDRKREKIRMKKNETQNKKQFIKNEPHPRMRKQKGKKIVQ